MVVVEEEKEEEEEEEGMLLDHQRMSYEFWWFSYINYNYHCQH